MFCFDTMPACDGHAHTHAHTHDNIYCTSIALRSKNQWYMLITMIKQKIYWNYHASNHLQKR